MKEIFITYGVIIFIVTCLFFIYRIVDEAYISIFKNEQKKSKIPLTPNYTTELFNVIKTAKTFNINVIEQGMCITKKELKKRYWTKAKKVHPDIIGGDGKEFRRLKKDYDFLLPYSR